MYDFLKAPDVVAQASGHSRRNSKLLWILAKT